MGWIGKVQARWMRIRRRQARTIATLAASVAALLATPAAAPAAVPYQDVSSSGPLEHIYLGNELSCQAKLTTDTGLSFFNPVSIPGDCGTLLTVGGTTYSPDWGNNSNGVTATGLSAADGTRFTPVSQTPVTGTGTSIDPFTVTTVVNAGASLAITQMDTYVTGNPFYRSQITVSNTSGTPTDAILYHAGDCFLAESDDGYGHFDAMTGGIFCSLNPDNVPPGRLIGFVPLDAGNSYLEDQFYTVWQAINGSPLADTVRPNDFIDNGAGLSWNITVPVEGSVTRSLNTVIDITGGGSTPTPTPATSAASTAPAAATKKKCKKGRHLKRGKCVKKKKAKAKKEPGFTG